MKLKLLIVGGAILLGGTAAASSVVFNGGQTGSQTHEQATVEPSPAEKAQAPANQPSTDQTASTGAQTSSDDAAEPSGVGVKPQPEPQPVKPAIIYSDHPSAATPCRLLDRDVYTNDCSATVRPSDPAPQPVDANPAPADNSGTAVSNQN